MSYSHLIITEYQPALAYPLYPFRALENETLMYAKPRFLIFFNSSLIPD